MNEIWKNWEGQVVEHKYRLQSLIGSTDHSVVFLAEYRSPEPRKATVKFLAADIPNAELVIAAWNKAQHLSHPNLQQILGTGRWKTEDRELLYVAMEYAEENLAEIVPQRALTAQEAREALNPIVDVLVYLHGKDLTHGHVCPANILAIGDQLKVSSDTIEPVAEKREMTRERSAYDAPEIPGAAYTQAADIWSLGAALVAMLTQQPAVLPFNEGVDPVIPQAVREPFLEIARNTLRRKPESRWTGAQIAERLNPNRAAAKAAAAGASATTSAASTVSAPGTVAPATPVAPQASSVAQVAPEAPRPTPASGSSRVEPLSVPLSKEPPAPRSKQPRPAAPPVHGTAPAVKRAQRETFVLPNYALPAFLGALILAGIIALPLILRSRTETKSGPATASAPAAKAPASDAGKAASEAPLVANTPSKPAAPQHEEARNFTPPAPSAVPALSPAPAVLRSTENAPPAKARNSSDAQGRGEVFDQPLPQVSEKALSTISGTVRVVVKAHVDAAGQVAGAELQEPGPSRYFADKAVQAAQRWLFNSPEVNGRSVESDWLIRFEYTHDGIRAIPQQVTP